MSKIKVLIVEDERLIAENSAIILERLGYEVGKICSNSQAALAEIRENRPDIVLIDILLQGEHDGITFAETLRYEHDIPFVFVTATSDESILNRAKVTSPYGYIIKPFNEKDLHSNIEMALYKFNTEIKFEHLNEMLYALNDINQIDDKDADETVFLKRLCETLTKSSSFQYAWAGLLEPDLTIRFKTYSSQAELPDEIQPFKADGTLADCIRETMAESEAQVAIYPIDSCRDCILAEQFSDKPLVNVRIAFEDTVFGVLSTVVLPSMAANSEFLSLFTELAQKAGSHLHSMLSRKQVGHAEKALARSEERFRRFTEIAQDMILVHDLTGTISYINPATVTILDYPTNQIIDHNLDVFVAPRSLAEMDERLKEQLKGNTTQLRYEMFLLSRTGEEIPVEVSSNPMVEKGRATNFLLIGHDVRDRKLQEMRLERLSKVVEQSPTAILITDSQGLITYVNPRFITMTGFTREEIIGEYPAALKTDSITDEIATDLIATTMRGDVWRGELETIRSNHEKFWVNATISGLSDNEGKFSYIGVIEDISEKKLAALDLERSRQSYQDIFNSTSDAIYIQSKEGQFIDVNQGAVNMYGYDRDYFIGKTPAILSADGYNDLDEVHSAIRRAFKGEPQRFEFWGKRKNGEIFPKDVQVNKVHYFGEEVLLTSARDISDQKKFEDDLQKAAHKAEKSEEVKGYFLANMSHEIRTPLTSIVGYIDLIFNRIKGHLSDQDVEYFDIIRRNSDRLTSTLHSIIDLSQIEAGAIKVKKASINLTKLVAHVYTDQRMAAEKKKIKFTYHEPPESFWIIGDKGLLHTAIANLVDNAINYTDEGQVDLLLTTSENGCCLLEIRDTGIGIAQNSLHSIFESFNQESMGYTKDYQGLGLGLTISKKNFELHEVKIEVESVKGSGSSFFIRFPKYDVQLASETPDDMPISQSETVQQNTAEHTSPTTGTSDNLEGPRNILIVEDDENAQRLFGLFLHNTYEVHFTNTVTGGKEILESTPIDLVVTDLSLIGGEDGLALVKWVREDQRFGKLPMIALTAHAFVSDREKCLNAGCNDFITKPIFRSQLLDIIKKNLTN